VVAAKPTKEISPPITLYKTEAGDILPTIKWTGLTSYSYSSSGLAINFEIESMVDSKVLHLQRPLKLSGIMVGLISAENMAV
jgi:hypothetical protein